MMVKPLNGLITRDDIIQLSQDEGWHFDGEIRIPILESMQSIDVQACPGSGKTTLIAAKLMLLAKKWPLSGRGICVLSHTNVAKNEIIERLKRSKTREVQRLFSYPHFIGTIQEFVGKFLAFPYLRANQLYLEYENEKPSLGVPGFKIDVNYVDTDMCVELIESKISPKTKAHINKKSRFSKVLYGFDLKYENGKLSLNVPNFKKPSAVKSYQDLHKVRSGLMRDGYLFYKDVFTFAQMALIKHPLLSDMVCERFPIVLLDEMQDTIKFQDELLCQVFPLKNPKIIVQRFGDPDQAIFNGKGDEESNRSFNRKQVSEMNFVIEKSHRFDEALANKIRSLSVNRIKLSTDIPEDKLAERLLNACSQHKRFQHCVIVFDDSTLGRVIQSFGEIVSRQFNEEYKNSEHFTVKALGAVGNEIDVTKEQLKIGHYWRAYDKNRTKQCLKENSLIEIVRYCQQSSTVDFAENYKMLIDGIIKWLILSKKFDENNGKFTPRTLQNFLKEQDKWHSFRTIIYSLLADDIAMNQERWKRFCCNLKTIFELQNMPNEAKQYSNYFEEVLLIECPAENNHGEDGGTLISLSENKIRHPDGFHIQLSTIHGVKGETHDAALVMETRNKYYDIAKLINHIAGLDASRITLKTRLQFSRQLYVAASRPRHLLCFAVHADNINDHQKQALTGEGWQIVSLHQQGRVT